MSLSIGIVGLPNVGKSTLFNALTRKSVDAQNYPFCTIDPSVALVNVPDERLDRLSEFSSSAKTVQAAVEFVDIAGLVRGASGGEGLGNQFLSNIRETDAIVQVVRLFEDESIVHVEGHVDPVKDVETINLELILSDMQTVKKRGENIAREVKQGKKEAIVENTAIEKLREVLEKGQPASMAVFTDEEQVVVRALHLLTSKPVLYVLNKSATARNLDDLEDERWSRLETFLKDSGARWVKVDAGVEQELCELEGDERRDFRRDLGAVDDGVDDLIRSGYELLDLMTFFTTGPEESRAWTVTRGSTAPEAGAAIHSDFKDKFIRAEVIHCKDLLSAGSHAVAREQGLIRTEGKEYVVKDGDVIEFKI